MTSLLLKKLRIEQDMYYGPQHSLWNENDFLGLHVPNVVLLSTMSNVFGTVVA